MPPQGDVARQWFIPGEGIERSVISGDVQRYLGNDATVRPGAGTGEYQGVQGYWIKAYRNLTNAMIADLRADSQRWRQEQRQTGQSSAYVDSTTYHESNAARISRRDGNSPGLDPYGNPAPRGQMDNRAADPRRQAIDPMQIDGAGRGPQPNQRYDQQGYYQQDPRGQYPDPRYPNQGRAPNYPQDQPMADVYGQPDAYGRYAVNPSYDQPGRQAPGYPPAPQGAPPGYTRQGDYWVPASSGYAQPGMMAGTLGPQDPGYFQGGQQTQQSRGPGQPNQRDPGARGDPRYGQPDPYNPYPSPAQTVANPDRRDYVNPAPPSNYGQPPPQYDQYGRPIQQQPPYSPDQAYPPPSRDANQGRQPPPSGGDDRRRRHR